MTLEHFLCLLKKLEKLYPLLTPVELANKIRLLAYTESYWPYLLGTKDEKFVETDTNEDIIDTLKKMTIHKVQAGVETGVIKVNKSTIALGKNKLSFALSV